MNLPVPIHPHFWRGRRVLLPGHEPQEIPTTSRRALEDAGFDILENRQPSFLFRRSILVTGEVEDHGLRARFPHPAGMGRRGLVARPPGARRPGPGPRREGQGPGGDDRVWPRRDRQHLPVRAPPLQGSPHLRGPRRLPPQRSALRTAHPPGVRRPGSDAPQVVVPAHCPGWRAQHAMAAQFQDAFIPNSVGTRFEL